jgi:hypothetical protein
MSGLFSEKISVSINKQFAKIIGDCAGGVVIALISVTPLFVPGEISASFLLQEADIVMVKPKIKKLSSFCTRLFIMWHFLYFMKKRCQISETPYY